MQTMKPKKMREGQKMVRFRGQNSAFKIEKRVSRRKKVDYTEQVELTPLGVSFIENVDLTRHFALSVHGVRIDAK